MNLVPSQDDVVRILRETGALRDTPFGDTTGRYAREYLQVPIAMRYFEHAKVLSVGLSRLIRANPELRAVLSELSIVAPATGGMPVAYGVSEALRTKQVYWGERERDGEPLQFRPGLEVEAGEQVILVDDILRTGSKLSELKSLVEAKGAAVVALAVLVYQPMPGIFDFGDIPLYYLCKLDPPPPLRS